MILLLCYFLLFALYSLTTVMVTLLPSAESLPFRAPMAVAGRRSPAARPSLTRISTTRRRRRSESLTLYSSPPGVLASATRESLSPRTPRANALSRSASEPSTEELPWPNCTKCDGGAALEVGVPRLRQAERLLGLGGART